MTMEVEELEAQIRAKPDDVALRAVHGDAVLERAESGDRKRGQLIHLALAGERGDAAAARQAWELQRKVRARLVYAIDRKYVVRMTWRHGSVESIALEARVWHIKQDELLERRTLAALRDLLDEPELFALRSLDTRTAGGTRIEPLVELVRHLPIRWLGVTNCSTRAELELLRALPQLDGLGIHNDELATTLAALEGQPWLRDLELSNLDGTAIHLVTRVCPRLERLVLYGIGTTWAELEPIFQRTALPALRDLGLMGPIEVTRWMLEQLLDRPLLSELRTLGLCAAGLYDAVDARHWFQHHAARFKHVRLFTRGVQPDTDRGHESGRLAMLLDSIGREIDGIEHQVHHLDHSGGASVHAGCWGRLANAYIANVHYKAGLRAVDKGIDVMGEAHGDAAYLFRTRAYALSLLDRHEAVEHAADAALALDGTCSWTWRYRGAAARELGKYDDAGVAFDNAIRFVKESDPVGYTSWAHLLRGELRWGRRDLEGAVADFERVLATVEPDDPEARRRARIGLGSIAYRRGDFAVARPHYVEALAASHDDSAAISCVCATLFQLGEYSLALTTWQIAAQQSDWLDIEEQGHVLLAMQRPEDALTAMAAGLETGGARAMALHALGRTDEAIAALDQFAIRPRHPEAACGFRLATGLLLQALLGRDPKRKLAKLRELPVEPLALHAALLRRLRGHDTSGCRAENCARQATVAVLAAAIASGDRDRARALAVAYAAYEDTQLISRLPELVWDLRSALRLSPSPLLAAALATLEHRAPTSAILDQAARGAGS